ncbi:EAL domain-containing protein [Undibacterium sp. Jales W-56]|uniref:LapD/MoxY N-terminal periplasmic domain-containing protein n=1 Tax=Undibacterium sp. Jales W-56 TaxID=2897325 RepID=UPI0021D10587|nr:LapD/MoxY N-terminal periplasmic domain-containing protein [Undibacterium sp. Jales W-56]MCU6434717.1 EAL domain-containing protein [Undibacterium sp. Jales W-56]
MSMYRQLWLAIILSTLLASMGSLLASTLSSRAYLNEQLRLKNADNASVLALSLSQKNADPVALELMVAALFDRGHYESISIANPVGKKMVERTAAAERSPVPQWFIQLFPLSSLPGQAQISDGWKQVGTISVVSQSGFAYQALWDSTCRMLAAIGLAGLIAGYLGTRVLRRLKQPLDNVIAQARALAERRFVTTPESLVPELRQLSIAMNASVNLLKSMFAEEASRLDSLRREANTDAITGLANRSHFMAQLQVMTEQENAAAGCLVMLHLTHFAELNQQWGRAKTDALLKAIGQVLHQQITALEDGFAARLNGSDFAILCRHPDAEPLAHALLESLKTTLDQTGEQPCRVCIGYSEFEYGMTAGNLLSQVDTAIASVEMSGHSDIRRAAPLGIAQAPKSQEEWAGLIQQALQQNRVKLALFPVADFNRHLLHQESALRLMFADNWFAAARFLPIAERLGLSAKLDLSAVTLGLTTLGQQPELPGLAINLSGLSIRDPGFREALRKLMQAHADLCHRLWLEIPEHGVLAHLDAFKIFEQMVRPSGCKIGLKHAGHQLSKLHLIDDVKLDYFKIDGAFVRSIDSNERNQLFIKGLTSIMGRIGTQVIAEGVVSREELETLARLGLAGATGAGVRTS